MKTLPTLLLAAALVLTACRTAPTSRPDGTPTEGTDREMIGLDDEPLTDDWKDWTPIDEPVTPARISEVATAFDYWHLTDRAFRERAWAALAAALGDVRANAGPEYEKTFRMLLTVLEPDMADGERHFDLTFMASKPDAERAWEGIGARIWRELPSGATPTVALLIRRTPGGSDAPSDVFLWFASDFEETPSLTLRIRRSGGASTLLSSTGITMAPADPFDGEADVLGAVLVQTFWEPFTASGYLETPVEHVEGENVPETGLPAAFGAKLGDRDIDQVFSDSVFPPRLTGFAPK